MHGQRLSVALAAVAFALLTTSCGGSGSPRPDIVLVSSRDGDYAIYALNADGGSRKRLSDAEGDPASPRGLFFQVQPAWSPDGSEIAFASKRAGSFDVYVMNADGTGTSRLTSGREDEAHPTWSADGTRIAFERGADLWVMSSDGVDAHLISNRTVPESQPAWSPDGAWIAYVRRTPGTPIRELWLVRPDGTGAHELTRFGRTVDGPAWSPDSKRVAFAADAEGSIKDIYSVGVDGKDLRRHTQASEDAFEPAWSPDGSTIAFARAGAIFTVTLDGNVEDITDPENNDSFPAWNPVAPTEED